MLDFDDVQERSNKDIYEEERERDEEMNNRENDYLNFLSRVKSLADTPYTTFRNA